MIPSGIARRNCLKINSTFAQWMTADLSDCVSFWLNDFLYEVSSLIMSDFSLLISHSQKMMIHEDIIYVIFTIIVTVLFSMTNLSISYEIV